MAIKMAIIGFPNTGKSYARRFLRNVEENFLITPTGKSTHMQHKDGSRVQPLDIKIVGTTTTEGWDAVAKKLKAPNRHAAVDMLVKGGLPPGTEITGNYAIVPKLKDVEVYLKFIDKYMPHIKNVYEGDFTHYIVNLITSKEFRGRKSGGEAFAKYYDLAADSLEQILLAPDNLSRDDLIVVTEYHAKYDEDLDIYRVFVPAGNMLSEKIQPESYYDYILHTHVLDWDDEKDDSKRYKFVITKKQRYDGRLANLFPEADEGMIPNNMQEVIDRVKKNEGVAVM